MYRIVVIILLVVYINNSSINITTTGECETTTPQVIQTDAVFKRE